MQCSASCVQEERMHGNIIEKFAKLEGNMIYMGIVLVIIVVCSVAAAAKRVAQRVRNLCKT